MLDLHYETDDGRCLTPCPYKGSGIMMGSMICQECESYIDLIGPKVRCNYDEKIRPISQELQAEEFFTNLKEIREECKKHLDDCREPYKCPFYRRERYNDLQSVCIVREELTKDPELWNFQQLHGRMLDLRSLKANRKEQKNARYDEG